MNAIFRMSSAHAQDVRRRGGLLKTQAAVPVMAGGNQHGDILGGGRRDCGQERRRALC